MILLMWWWLCYKLFNKNNLAIKYTLSSKTKLEENINQKEKEEQNLIKDLIKIKKK